MELEDALTRKSHAPLAPLLRKAENEGVRFLGGDSSRLFEDELNVNGQFVQSLPRVSLWQQAWEWMQMAFQAVAPHYDAAARLIEHFSRAGLPHPTLFCESPVDGGKDSPLYGWTAETLKSFVPQLVRMQVLTADTIAIDTFEDRLREAVVEARSQIVGPAQSCAWTRV